MSDILLFYKWTMIQNTFVKLQKRNIRIDNSEPGFESEEPFGQKFS